MKPQDWLTLGAAIIAIAAAIVARVWQRAEERGERERQELRAWLNRRAP